MSNVITIAGRNIGSNEPPYIIAEVSANHNGDLSRALQLIDVAADAGADAVKIQTYRPETITMNAATPDFRINEGKWAGRTLHELYEWAHTPWDWHSKLFEHAKQLKITLFSSPFDETAVDFLSDLKAPAFKIASFEAVDLPLIRYTAAKGKPMIISTGMANFQEISEAVFASKSAGCNQLALLHCVSGYPAPPSDYNLKTITDMAQKFNVPIGLSDHTLDNTTAIASIALGAKIIEKHITLDRNGGGPDDSFSLEPKEFRDLCTGIRTAWEAIGYVHYGEKSSERSNIQLRRSLYFTRSMKAGETITKSDIRSIRPGYGLEPKFCDDILGRILRRDVDFAEPVKWTVLE